MSVATQRTKRRQHREETRARSSTPPRRSCASSSFRELSVDALMSRTGHTRTVFYRHFDDIPSLVLALIAGGRRRARRGRASSGRRPSASAPRRRASGSALFVDFYVRNGPLVHAVAEAAHHDDAVEQAYDAMVEGFIAITDAGDRGARRARRAGAARRARDRARAGADAQRLPRRLARPRARHRPGARARNGLRRSGPGRCSRTALSAIGSGDRLAGTPGSGPGRGRPRTAGRGGTPRARRPAGARRSAPASGSRSPRCATRSGRRWSSCATPARSSCCATRSGAGRSTDPVTAWVERIDPLTLEPLARSPDLASGPFWPGGMAAHANGSLHRRHRQPLPPPLRRTSSCSPTRGCPAPRPVQLVRRPRRRHARDEGLRPRPARAGAARPARPGHARAPLRRRRRSARPRSRGCRPTATTSTWSAPRTRHAAALGRRSARARRGLGRRRTSCPGSSYGWDPVIAGGQLWFLDNGAHDFVTTMRGAGVAPGPVHLHPHVARRRRRSRARRGLRRCRAARSPTRRSTTPSAGSPSPTTRPTASSRRSASTSGLTPLWRRELSHAAHMILYAETGELVLHDFHGPAFAAHPRRPGARCAASTAMMRHAALRRLATRASRDEVVVRRHRDRRRARPRAGARRLMQSVVFPAPGFDRDLYWVTITTLARLVVRPA